MKKFRKYSAWSKKLNGFINVIADSKPKALEMAKEKDLDITSGKLIFRNDSFKEENKIWVVGKSKSKQKTGLSDCVGDDCGAPPVIKLETPPANPNLADKPKRRRGPRKSNLEDGCSDCGTLDDGGGIIAWLKKDPLVKWFQSL